MNMFTYQTGRDFGSITCGSSLILNGAESKSFQDSEALVESSSFFWSIEPSGISSSFELELIEEEPSEEYPDRLWGSNSEDVNLLEGLTTPTVYSLQVYVSVSNNVSTVETSRFTATFTLLCPLDETTEEGGEVAVVIVVGTLIGVLLVALLIIAVFGLVKGPKDSDFIEMQIKE